MDYSYVENKILEVAKFFDGLSKDIPKVDFKSEYYKLKQQLLLRENYSLENFTKFLAFIEAMFTFSICLETRQNKIEFKRYPEEEIMSFCDQFDFFRNHEDEPYEFISSHFPELFPPQERYRSVWKEAMTILYDGAVVDDKSEENQQSATQKLLWLGTPGQLAFFLNLLKEKGYINNLPASGEGRAKIILSHFEIKGHNTTVESLGRCFQRLNNDELPINPDDASKFQKIPNRSDLKR